MSGALNTSSELGYVLKSLCRSPKGGCSYHRARVRTNGSGAQAKSTRESCTRHRDISDAFAASQIAKALLTEKSPSSLSTSPQTDPRCCLKLFEMEQANRFIQNIPPRHAKEKDLLEKKKNRREQHLGTERPRWKQQPERAAGDVQRAQRELCRQLC